MKYVVHALSGTGRPPRSFRSIPAMARYLQPIGDTVGAVEFVVMDDDGSERYGLTEREMRRLNAAMAALRPPAGRW